MFNIFSTLKQGASSAANTVGGFAGTINQNLQNFGGDVYDTYSGAKQGVQQAYGQAKGAVQDYGNTIARNVSNAYQDTKKFSGDVANAVSRVPGQLVAPVAKYGDEFMKDLVKRENARKATEFGISNKDKDAIMNQMLDEGIYSDDEIIQAVTQLDADEQARKKQMLADYNKQAYENSGFLQKRAKNLADISAGTASSIGQAGLNIVDFATGGKIPGLKEEAQQYANAGQQYGDSTAFNIGRGIGTVGQMLATPSLPFAPKGTGWWSTAGRGATYGGVFGALSPVTEKGSETTMGDIKSGALTGAAVGAVAGPLLEKVAVPAIAGTVQGIKGASKGIAQGVSSGIKQAQNIEGTLSEKASAGLKATGKSLGRQIKSIPMGGETITRAIPEKIVANEMGFNPTQRAKIEKITGKNEAQYLLERNLAGKSKEELAQHFMKQADDAYNGITQKLAKIDTKVKSEPANQALQDIIDQLTSSNKLARFYKSDIEAAQKMLENGNYTLSDLNNIRRAYDKVNTGMFTSKGQIRSGVENDVDVAVRKGISDTLQKEAKKFGVDVKQMNTDLRAGLEMKDAILTNLSQQRRNNFLGLQDLGISAILSGGNPAAAAASLAAQKYAQKVAPSVAQKTFNLSKKPYARTVSRGNTITPRGKSSSLGLVNSASNNVVSTGVKPSIIKPNESILSNKGGYINPSEMVQSGKNVIEKGKSIVKSALSANQEARQFYDDLVKAGNSPIVAQRETAKKFGTMRAMSASKAGTFGGEGAKEKPTTGWFEGADGKMRFEIDDSKAKGVSGAMVNKNGKALLGDILDHKDLYEQYPELKNIVVQFNETTEKGGGHFNKANNTIQINGLNRDPYTGEFLGLSNEAKSTLLHEIQHAIQEKEGFATGGSVGKLTYDEYFNLPGEVEAREVQSRMDMTKEQRKKIAPKTKISPKK